MVLDALCHNSSWENSMLGKSLALVLESWLYILQAREVGIQNCVRGLYEHWRIFTFQMSNITVTYRDGRVAQLEQVYIRGSKIRFLILPDMLKNAPMLKSMKNKNQGSGAGRGKAAILKAQGVYNLCVPPPSPHLSPPFAVEELENCHLYHWGNVSCKKLKDYLFIHWFFVYFILWWESRLKLPNYLNV